MVRPRTAPARTSVGWCLLSVTREMDTTTAYITDNTCTLCYVVYKYEPITTEAANCERTEIFQEVETFIFKLITQPSYFLVVRVFCKLVKVVSVVFMVQ